MEFLVLLLGYFLLAYVLCCILVGISVLVWHCTCKKRGDRIAALKVAEDKAKCYVNLEKFLIFYLAVKENEVPSCSSSSSMEIDEMDDGMTQKQREERLKEQTHI